ncbi:MAG: hypothetical protein KC680_01775 [Candidatus Peregrinibacteria bacterium]|nr:hypothetical protein [Candidatus Peregrinibacteria bacterium]MCB9807903.1 hypothetical protein [Candidatus Peribacteria bacterium]
MENTQPLWKQILGAIIGGGLALAVYYAYEYTKPKVEAYLTLPPADRMYDLGTSHIADKTMDEGDRKRILSRNVRVAQQMGENSALETVDDHRLDIAWPGNDPTDPKYTEVTGIVPEPEVPVPMVEVDILEEQMATSEMEMDNWEALWGDIQAQEDEQNATESVDAEALPDTGFGLGVIAAGAAGGALASRKRKRKMA